MTSDILLNLTGHCTISCLRVLRIGCFSFLVGIAKPEQGFTMTTASEKACRPRQPRLAR